MSRFALEVALHWTAVGLYIVASVLFGNVVLFVRPPRLRFAIAAACAGLVPHSAALVIRWVASGHGPYMLKYEVLSSNAFIAIAVTLIFVARKPAWSAVALVVMPVSLLLISLGLFSNPELRDLPPSLRSIWLVFHISFAKVSSMRSSTAITRSKARSAS